MPRIEEIKGALKVFVFMAVLTGVINPFANCN